MAAEPLDVKVDAHALVPRDGSRPQAASAPQHVLRRAAWFRPGLLGAVALAIAGFAGYRIIHDARLLSDHELHFQPLAALGALPLLAAGVLLTGLAWMVLLRSASGSQERRYGRLTRVFLFAWMGRYLPGKLPYFVGKVYLARQLGYATTPLVVATAVENVLQLLVASAFGAVMVLVALGVSTNLNYLWLALLAVPAIGLLHPRLLAFAANRALRITGRGELPAHVFPSFGAILAASAVYIAAAAANGVGFQLSAMAVTDLPWSALALSMGVFALSGVIGIIVLFAPAGLGAREASITGGLATTVGVQTAAAAALSARVLATVVDLLLVGAAVAVDFASGDRLLAKTLAGRSDGGDVQPLAVGADERAAA